MEMIFIHYSEKSIQIMLNIFSVVTENINGYAENYLNSFFLSVEMKIIQSTYRFNLLISFIKYLTSVINILHNF